MCLKIPKITKFLWNLLLKESILVQIPVESAYILYRIVSIIVAIVYYHHREPLSWFIFIAHADNSALSIDWLVEYECIINKYNYLYFVYLTYTSKPTVVFLWTHICLLDLVNILSYFFFHSCRWNFSLWVLNQPRNRCDYTIHTNIIIYFRHYIVHHMTLNYHHSGFLIDWKLLQKGVRDL